MTARDAIQREVEKMLELITVASDDTDLTKAARDDLRWLARGIGLCLNQFNQPVGDGPWSDGGPTGADLAGEVQHDIG
jgi:hypothetical protein